jgi:hypothetical protein
VDIVAAIGPIKGCVANASRRCDVLKKQADWAKQFDQLSVSQQKKYLVPDKTRAHPQLKIPTSIWIKGKKKATRPSSRPGFQSAPPGEFTTAILYGTPEP